MGLLKSIWQVLVRFYHRCASPPHFYRISGAMLPWCAALTAILFAVGLTWGLVYAPTEVKQGEVYRVLYIHVPAASLMLMIYVFIVIAAAIGMVWRMKMAQIVAREAVPIGASFAFLALVTGAIWGKPTWGTYFEFRDPRMLSTLILFLLYVGLVVINRATEDKTTAANATAILSIAGVVTVPIVYLSTDPRFSHIFGNTIHQQQTRMFDKSQMTPDMAYALLIMMFAFLAYFVTVILLRIRNEIIDREQNAVWVKETLLK